MELDFELNFVISLNVSDGVRNLRTYGLSLPNSNIKLWCHVLHVKYKALIVNLRIAGIPVFILQNYCSKCMFNSFALQIFTYFVSSYALGVYLGIILFYKFK